MSKLWTLQPMVIVAAGGRGAVHVQDVRNRAAGTITTACGRTVLELDAWHTGATEPTCKRCAVLVTCDAGHLLCGTPEWCERLTAPTVTLAEIVDALPDSTPTASEPIPYAYGARIVHTGGNVVAVSVVLRGVPLLLALGDGVSEGRDFSVSSDYAEHLDTYAEGTAGSVEDVILAAEEYVCGILWTDTTGTVRVPVYGSEDMRDAADDWQSDMVTAQSVCGHCGQWIYRDTMSPALVYRAHTDGSSYCTADGIRVHSSPRDTYWQSVSSLGATPTY